MNTDPNQVPNPLALLRGDNDAHRDGGLRAPKNRHPAGLRRANPKHPEAIDDFVVALLKRARREQPAAKELVVRREGIAAWLKVPEHFVDQALERLKQQGLLATAINQAAHDSPRAGIWGGPNSAWSGSVWRVHDEALDALLAQDVSLAPRAARPRR